MSIEEYAKLLKDNEEFKYLTGSRIADAMCGIVQAKEEVKNERVNELLDIAVDVLVEYHYLLSIMKK